MQVLKNNHANAVGPCEVLEENPEKPVTRFIIARDTPTAPRYLCGNLVHRGEWSRRGEPVARSPKRARVAPMLRHESLDQGALAEPRFSGQEYELAGSRACFLEAPVQSLELSLALQQVHWGVIIRQ